MSPPKQLFRDLHCGDGRTFKSVVSDDPQGQTMGE
jgi:hypothetical protein